VADLNAEARETVDLIGATVTFIPMDPGTPYALVEWDAKVGAISPPVHVHHKTDEAFYVMSGKFAFLLDGVQTFESPGAHVLVPMGHAHTFWNAGRSPARCLVIVSPPGFEGYFRELAMLLATAESEDDAIQARVRLSARWDIEVAGTANPAGATGGKPASAPPPRAGALHREGRRVRTPSRRRSPGHPSPPAG
jgi:mannose-6-phosphate isomerase-like protein (cupin superfamily)